MSLARRYGVIERRLRRLTDFSIEELEKSRVLFTMRGGTPVPRRFNVWTCLCGLPVPDRLATRLRSAAERVAAVLPRDARAYWVAPENYHWELFIIKRPDERLPTGWLRNVPTVLEPLFAVEPAFTIAYRGLLVTTDGTVMARGYGEFDRLRRRLRRRLPFASPRQSILGHISLGRILDPIGRERFAVLKRLVAESRTSEYGILHVRQVKYVHETRWYLTEREILGRVALR